MFYKSDFEKFYQANLDRIYRYIYWRVGHNRVLTEDLVSEIFLKALQHFDRYDPTISRSAWIYRIAHNHLANYWRDTHREVDVDELVNVLPGLDGRTVMETKGAVWILARCLEALPILERRLVTMKYLEGYSYGEMAEILGRSNNALKVATHRAMKKLKVIARPSLKGVKLCSDSTDN